jgi:hypothetical protein
VESSAPSVETLLERRPYDFTPNPSRQHAMPKALTPAGGWTAKVAANGASLPAPITIRNPRPPDRPLCPGRQAGALIEENRLSAAIPIGPAPPP